MGAIQRRCRSVMYGFGFTTFQSEIKSTRRRDPCNVDYGHLSASLDLSGGTPRQSALSRERQRLSVVTLTLWSSETG